MCLVPVSNTDTFQENWNLLGMHSHWLLSAGRSGLNAFSVVSHFLLKSHPISKRTSGTEGFKHGSYPYIKNYLLTWKMHGTRYIWRKNIFIPLQRSNVKRCLYWLHHHRSCCPTREEILATLHISRHFWVFQQILQFMKELKSMFTYFSLPQV